jgi:hypothetical protein
MDNITQSNEAKAEFTEAKAEAHEGSNVEGSTDDSAQANAKSESSQESVNDRLLKESKQWKAQALEHKKELEKLKEAEKKKQGKFQEIADEYKAKYEELQKKIVKQKVENALIAAAPKYGYAGKSHETLLRLGDGSLLQYDEGTEEVQGVDLYLESLKKTEPALFRNVETKINDKAPSMHSMISKKTPTTWDEKYNDLKQKLGQTLGQ